VVEHSTADPEIKGLNPAGAWYKEKMAEKEEFARIHFLQVDQSELSMNKEFKSKHTHTYTHSLSLSLFHTHTHID
jgi:hypothetical protein